MKHPVAPRPADRLKLAYLYGGLVVYQPGEVLAPRVLTDYELVLMLEGTANYVADGHAHRLAPGAIVLARPGFHESYAWDRRQRTRHAYFHFGIESVPRDWPPPERWPIVRSRACEALPALFRVVLNRVIRHADWPSQRPGLSDCRLVESLMDLFVQCPGHDAPGYDRERPESVQRAVKWMREVIDADPGRRVTLADLAKAAHVTPKHLCRVFARDIGRSPVETYRLLRLQLGLALLARSELAIKEVANRCGFDDALHFSRCFSRAFGQSPRATRARMRSGRPPPASPLAADLMPRLYW